MNTKFLLFSLLGILLFGCKKEYEIERKESVSIQFAHGKLSGSNELAAVIVSNTEGNILLEKLISKNEIETGFDLSFKKEKSEITCVSLFFRTQFNQFEIISFYDVKANAIFDRPIDSVLREKIDISIEGLRFPEAAEYKLNDLSFRSFFSSTTGGSLNLTAQIEQTGKELLFSIRDSGDVDFRYFYRPDFREQLDLDYQSLPVLEKFGGIPFRYSSTGIPFVEAINNLNGKTLALCARRNESLDSIFIYGPPGLDLKEARLHIITGGFTALENIDLENLSQSYPPSYCDTRDLIQNHSKPSFFLVPYFSPSAAPDYFKISKSYKRPESTFTTDHWTIEGVYDSDFKFILPRISDDVLNAIPSLINLPTSSSSKDRVSIYHFEVFNQSDIWDNPLMIRELNWLYDAGTLVCYQN